MTKINYFYYISLVFSFLLSGSIENRIHVLYTDAIVEIHSIIDDKVVGFGTGFIVNKDGLVVTNAHVIKNAEKVIIITKDNKEYEVRDYYQINDTKDYAILKIDSKGKKLKYLYLGDSEKTRVGDNVIAVGNPMGLKYTMTSGIVSSKRTFDNIDYFQIDADIAPGSSGGPLFNQREEVIGVTTMGMPDNSGLNFAIPINYIKKVISYNLKAQPYSQIIKNNVLVNNKNNNKNNNLNNAYSCEDEDEYDYLLGCSIYVYDEGSKKWYDSSCQIYNYCFCEYAVLLEFYDNYGSRKDWTQSIEDKYTEGLDGCYYKFKE